MNPPKALFIRMDRLGDLILTLPADQHPVLKGHKAHWFITKGLGFVLDHGEPSRDYTAWKKEFSWTQTMSFFKSVKELQPEVSVCFHAPWWVNFTLWLARVPKRVGLKSKWHSYLFLNLAVRQKRSRCEHHELDYNYLLVELGLQSQASPTSSPTPTLSMKPKAQALKELPENLPERFVVVHPGMGGSALNWSVDSYAQLVRELYQKDLPVVITGTASDRFMTDPLKEKLKDLTNVTWLNETLNGPQLIALLSKAHALFAPSTGVVHIGASLGIPTLGLYSPVTVESATRWAPRGPKVQVATPLGIAPPKGSVRIEKEDLNKNCMDLVKPQEMAETIASFVH